MKKTIKLCSFLLLTLMPILCFVSCTGKIDTNALWENATYLSDTTLGDGANTVRLELIAGEKTIVLTIKTDKPTLGEALYEHNLIDNDNGLFNICNGIKADWNKDNAYWAFYADDSEMIADYGIFDSKAVTTGGHTYKIVYTK